MLVAMPKLMKHLDHSNPEKLKHSRPFYPRANYETKAQISSQEASLGLDQERTKLAQIIISAELCLGRIICCVVLVACN